MNFCPNCENILYKKQIDNDFYNVCHICGSKFNLSKDDMILESSIKKIDPIERIIEGAKLDPFINKEFDKKCEKCNQYSPKKINHPITYKAFYICSNPQCENVWEKTF